MIIGTAGHIDHGKTTLVRALTGVETDRLKEEKIRGISIELGYAYTPLDNGEILGFIDVPGHERLVHTMAAGASGIDFGLLVVAADDGVMPQTREHLAILTLLGLQHGAVALTKSDRVDDQRLLQVQHEITALVQQTFLQNAPIFPVSATANDMPGVATLKHYLDEQAQVVAARAGTGLFRLAVDRVFTLPGHGTVVTGTAHAGTVRVNDAIDLRLMPANKPVRVRSIHAQNQASQAGLAGQRCALNLGGLDKADVQRGDWIADARCFIPSHNVDVTLSLLDGDYAPVRAWSPLHIHIGAAHYLAHVVPLTHDSLAPGELGKAQLVFDQPVCAMPGDRFIARNAQARLTVGGGMVLDPNGPSRKRRSLQRLAWLDGMSAYLTCASLSGLLEQANYGLDEDSLLRLTGIEADQLAVPQGALWKVQAGSRAARTLILTSTWDALTAKALQALLNFHQAAPDEAGLDVARLRRIAAPTAPLGLWAVLCEELISTGAVKRNGPWLHAPDHTSQLSDTEAALAARLLSLLSEGAFDPPWPRDLAVTVQQPPDDVRLLLRKLVRRGELFQVVRDLFYQTQQLARLAALLSSLAGDNGITAAEFRDATGLGRKRAIQILEFFGRIGYTRRLGDKHILRDNSGLFTDFTA
ncbi:MAG: selenocysteine-specific translation elongation factor [Burkholderiaceae bacterium]|nr:selenocysteine-specific translation elongation factor [Burkholderiaceae bacterium]